MSRIRFLMFFNSVFYVNFLMNFLHYIFDFRFLTRWYFLIFNFYIDVTKGLHKKYGFSDGEPISTDECFLKNCTAHYLLGKWSKENLKKFRKMTPKPFSGASIIMFAILIIWHSGRYLWRIFF